MSSNFPSTWIEQLSNYGLGRYGIAVSRLLRQLCAYEDDGLKQLWQNYEEVKKSTTHCVRTNLLKNPDSTPELMVQYPGHYFF